MEKKDRLGWAAGLSLPAHRRRGGIRGDDPAVLRQLPDRLPPGWKRVGSPIVEHLYSLVLGGDGPRANVRRFNLLYAGSARLARALDLDQVLESLESDLQQYIAGAAKGRLFVHAGVVGWRAKAIVLPGRTLSGKTTLVAALARAGAAYYSDEYAVFDARGRVHPYPKPLSIREGIGGRPEKSAVEGLGGRAGVRSLPLGLLPLTQYRPGGRWRPPLLSPGQAALALLANTVAARRRPRAAPSTLRRVASQVPVLKGTRGEAEEMVEAILDKLENGTATRRSGAATGR